MFRLLYDCTQEGNYTPVTVLLSLLISGTAFPKKRRYIDTLPARLIAGGFLLLIYSFLWLLCDMLLPELDVALFFLSLGMLLTGALLALVREKTLGRFLLLGICAVAVIFFFYQRDSGVFLP